MIPVNIDLVDDANELVPNQFYDKANFREILKQNLEELQVSNDVVFYILDNLNIEDATGYLLDAIGSYVAVLRQGDTDEPYRDRIKRAILTASSEGTPNELLEILSTATNGFAQIFEHYPVASYFSTNGTIIPSNLREILQEASPACSGDVIVYLDPLNNTFIPRAESISTANLINEKEDLFINQAGDNIVVSTLGYDTDGNERALLSEFTYGQGSGSQRSTPDFKGILCEIVAPSGGVVNFEYLSLYNAILSWWIQMNYTTPDSMIIHPKQ